MTTENSSSSDDLTDIEKAIEARLHVIDSGNYRANNDLILHVFANFLRDHRDITKLSELSAIDCRRYSLWLRKQVNDPDTKLSAASCHVNGPYFNVVHAFLEWCINDERIDSNPAKSRKVKEPLPEYTGDHDRQFWSKEKRKEITRYTRKQAIQSNEEYEKNQRRAYRNYAIVTTLALSGVRGAEIFSDPKDELRDGIKWKDIDFEKGIATVLGKTRNTQHVILSEEVIKALQKYKQKLSPKSEDWPVFPTRHHPKLSKTAKDGLKQRGYDQDKIDSLCSEHTSIEILYKFDIAPPAISKNGGRSVMKQICDEAEIEIDGEYLKPHGGRRGLGDHIYEKSAEFAQEVLRHRSVETTHKSYRDQKKAKNKEKLDQFLSEDSD